MNQNNLLYNNNPSKGMSNELRSTVVQDFVMAVNVVSENGSRVACKETFSIALVNINKTKKIIPCV